MSGRLVPDEEPPQEPRELTDLDIIEFITAMEAHRRHTGTWDDAHVRELMRRYGESLDRLAGPPIRQHGERPGA